MDQVVDYEAYADLKRDYDQLVDNSRHLESENESLVSSNRLLKRLLSTLESIKQSLEQKVLIISSNSNGFRSQQLVPFDSELQRLDEDYCHFKCLLNRLEFDDTDAGDGVDDQHLDSTDGIDNADHVLPDNQLQEDQYNIDSDNHHLITTTGTDQLASGDYSARDLDDNDVDDDDDNEDTMASDGCDQTSTTSGQGFQYVVHTLSATASAAEDLITGHSYHGNSSSILSVDDLTVSRRQRTKRSKGDVTPGIKRFQCPWNGCEYATDSSGNFQKHYRIHTGEKPYRCDFLGCEYSCSDPGSIKEHKRIHSSEKQFGCDWDGCTWRFSTYKLLKNHKRACHTMEKPHKCDWPGCDKSFLAPYALRTHKLKHTGARPHKCDISGCAAAFARPTDLARHKRETHCSERLYACEHEDCGSKFYRRDDLRHHIRRKHDCPQFGRRAKRQRKSSDTGPPIGGKELAAKRTVGARRKLSLKTENTGSDYTDSTVAGVAAGGTGSENTDALDEPKVVIDLNMAKVNHLRKSIQINFV